MLQIIKETEDCQRLKAFYDNQIDGVDCGRNQSRLFDYTGCIVPEFKTLHLSVIHLFFESRFDWKPELDTAIDFKGVQTLTGKTSN